MRTDIGLPERGMVGREERRLVHDGAKRAQERYLLLTPEFSREIFQAHA